MLDAALRITLITIATAVAVLLVPRALQELGKTPEQRAEAAQQAEQEAQEADALASLCSGLDPIIEAPAAQRCERARNQADLKAQEGMRTAAYVQAGISFLALIGLIFTVIFARGAYKETRRGAISARRAAREARRQANIAAEQLRLSQESAEAARKAAEQSEIMATSDRAWLFVNFLNHSRIERIGGTPRFGMEVAFSVANHGRTPAIIRTVLVEMYWAPGLWAVRELDPGAPGAEGLRNVMAMGMRDPLGQIWPLHDDVHDAVGVRAAEIIIDANERVGPVQGRVVWQRDLPPEADAENVFLSNFFFRCVVAYEDVHGRAHETSYYREIRAGNTALTLPNAIHNRYNRRS